MNNLQAAALAFNRTTLFRLRQLRCGTVVRHVFPVMPGKRMISIGLISGKHDPITRQLINVTAFHRHLSLILSDKPAGKWSVFVASHLS
jgi:hypothetical protein